MTTSTYDALSKIVGSERVSDNQEILTKYSGIRGQQIPSLVVWPQSVEDVVRIVEYANTNTVALIPVSSGLPRIRGDSTPKVDGATIIDLSKMKRIIRVDTRNKVAMIEAGVTYGELLQETEKHELKLLMPFLPKATKSVLAACLDRERNRI